MIRKVLTAVTVLAALTACSPKPAAQAPADSSAAPAAAMAAAPVVNSFDCSGPVGPKDTAKSLLAKYGADAAIGDIAGAEGMTTKGLILYGKDPSRRLEVSFWDEAMEHVSEVSPGDKATAWTGPAGLHLGSTVADAEAANGKAFSIAGFGWDYGGYATDLKNGKLAALPGGCSLQLRFDNLNGDAPPDGISGDGVTVSSDDARIKKYAPVVTDIAVGWALPEGVKPSADDGGGD